MNLSRLRPRLPLRRPRLAVRTLLGLVAVAALLAFLSPGEAALDQGVEARVRRLVYGREFDFVAWTVEAAAQKLAEGAANSASYLNDDRRKQFVLETLALVEHIEQLDARVEGLYTDPAIPDPQAEAAPLLAELAALRARQQSEQPVAEAILQAQLSATLAELGLAPGGQPLPPVAFHTTPLPLALIVSPRDAIRQVVNTDINPGLTASEQAALEEEIDRKLNVASLIVPLGGVGTYPTMVQETSSLNWLAEVTAHEWVHNYLTLRPLGLSYFSSPALQTMNETTASLAGKEIGEALIRRYYPELAPPPPSPPPPPTPTPGPGYTPPAEATPPPFDFRTEMHETRVKVDALLAAGEVARAEQYMELRRRFIVDNGYAIRKLNQAYFAFYGSYADVPGAAGADPVGPAVVALRRRSPSLAAFLNRISWFTSYEQLERALGK